MRIDPNVSVMTAPGRDPGINPAVNPRKIGTHLAPVQPDRQCLDGRVDPRVKPGDGNDG